MPRNSAARTLHWTIYLMCAGVVAVTYHVIYLRLFYEAVAIGDTANPVLSPLHGLALTILNFPMMYLWSPLGDWLKPHLTDDGVISLFTKINAVVWGFLSTCLLWLTIKLIGRTNP